MTKAEKFNLMVPTLARYALMILAAKLSSGGWLPHGVSSALAADPALLEMASSLLIGAGTVYWYMRSKAKAAVDLVAGV